MNFYALGVGILFLLIQSKIAHGQSCPTLFTLNSAGNLCYYVDTTNQLTWMTAKERCNNLGATLAILDSVTLNNGLGTILQSLSTSKVFWIGLYDQGHESTFTWLGTGLSTTQSGYSNWNSTPKTDTTKNCAATGLGSIKNQWEVLACSTPTNYVCQTPLVPSNSLSCKTSVTTGNCPTHKGWVEVTYQDTVRCFYTNLSSSLNFIKAQETCEQQGLTLATFVQEDVWSNFILDRAVKYYNYNDYDFWIGLYDQNHEQAWYWNPTTTVATYSDWKASPGYDTTKNCAYMDSTAPARLTYQWTAAACSETRRYFCELPPKCISTG